ncbi:MAG: D-2-hydroxyacid dehydrogenase, partial [Chloroflexi bacterium]|nr:D-2-hydroxyacid dehydrogenase [Chloroflexota bacterium]
MNVLIASYLEPEYVEQIRAAAPEVTVWYHPELLGKPRYTADHTARPDRTPEQEAQWRDLLAKADILFDFDFSNREDLPELAPQLKWIQTSSAGIGQFVKRHRYIERTSWIFTTASGVHARPLAEFALMAMLMFAKDYRYLRESQEKQSWQRYSARELSQSTVGIIGLGKIGREVARLAHAFEMTVIGTRRHPERGAPDYIAKLYSMADLDAVLSQTDFLVIATPHTDETDNLISARELALLPKGAVVINIGRGQVIDQAALVAALQSGHLGGAALDVFAVEPLPPGDPLWAMPNVIVSPHSA